jgi:hypothetical protein
MYVLLGGIPTIKLKFDPGRCYYSHSMHCVGDKYDALLLPQPHLPFRFRFSLSYSFASLPSSP